MEIFSLFAIVALAAITARLWRDLRRLRRKIAASDPVSDTRDPTSVEVRLRALEAKDKQRDLETLKR